MWKKALVIVVLVIIFLVAGIITFLPRIATHQFYKALEDVDSVSFSNLELDLVDGHLRIYNLYVDDTSGNIANKKVHIELNALRIEEIKLRQMLFTRVFEVDSLILRHGQFRVSNLTKQSRFTGQKKKRISRSVLINHLVVDSISASVTLDTTSGSQPTHALLNASFDTLGISLSDVTGSTYQFGQIELDSVQFPFKDQVGRLEANVVYWNSNTRKLKVNMLAMRQNIKPWRYAQHFKFDKAHIELDVDSVVIPNLSKDIFTYGSQIDLQRIFIYHPLCNIYKDKRLPHPNTPQKFPFEALAEVEFPIQIDTISVKKGRLYFKETNRADRAIAKLNLTTIDADFINLTSQGPNKIGNWSSIKGRLVFYHQLSLRFNWRFDLRKQGKAFVFDAKIGKAPLTILNPFIMNTADAQFKSGQLLGGHFVAEGNKVNGEGRLEFYYKNMRVNMYEKENHRETWGSAIKASAANVFIRNNNLPGKNPHLGISFAEPQQDRFVIVYLWRLLSGGMQDIMIGSNNHKKAAQRKTEYLD